MSASRKQLNISIEIPQCPPIKYNYDKVLTLTPILLQVLIDSAFHTTKEISGIKGREKNFKTVESQRYKLCKVLELNGVTELAQYAIHFLYYIKQNNIELCKVRTKTRKQNFELFSKVNAEAQCGVILL